MSLVSVIMPYYKKKLFFYKAISSVINQSYEKIEIIIVYDDDDLNDLNFIKEKIEKHKNIKLIVNDKNYGVAYSRNIGINKSNGKYIAFLDCDDYWEKDKIFKQINFMEKVNCDLCFTSYNIVNENDQVIGLMKATEVMDYKKLKFSCDLGLSTVVLKKEIFSISKFPLIKTKEDYALWLILIKKNIVMLGLDIPLSNWRKTRGSLSNSFIQKIKDAYTIFYKFEKRGFFLTLFSILLMCLIYLKKKIFQKIKL